MYLLDTQEVMDLFSRDTARPIFRWLDETHPRRTDLFVSVLSIGQIAQAIEDMDEPPRNHWRRLCQQGRRSFEDAGGVIGIDAGIVEVWQANLRSHRLSNIADAEERLGEDDRLIIATAISRGYTLVTTGDQLLREIAARTTLTTIEL
jgi:predicted nucleic acid-binding protein